MLDGSVPMMLGDSLLLSLIGMFVVFLELILLAVMIVVVSKIIRGISKKSEAAPAPAPVVVAAPMPAPVPAAPAPVAVPAPTLTLTDVDEPTAATVMAVVSHQSKIPLNHLAFRSIKGVVELVDTDDREAAVIMALTAHKLNKPLNRLCFASIKKMA